MILSIIFILGALIPSLPGKTPVALLLSSAPLSSTPAAPLGELQEKSVKIFKGKIEDQVDFIARFPTREEAEETYRRLVAFKERMKEIMEEQFPTTLAEVERMKSYVLQVRRQTTVLEWCLYQIVENQEISLLPGEGVEVTLSSYCLNSKGSRPSTKEFYSLTTFPEKDAEWIRPLLDYLGRHPKKKFLGQGLIWNMLNGVAFDDLPREQQELLLQVVPEARERYGISPLQKKAKSLFGSLRKKALKKVKKAVPVIYDVENLAAEIENRRSKLKLILPKHDVFRLENGLLVKVKSTGSFQSLTLIVGHPRNEGGAPEVRADVSGRFRVEGRPSGLMGGQGIFYFTPASLQPAARGPALSEEAELTVAWQSRGRLQRGLDWWSDNKERIEDFSNKTREAAEILDRYNEEGLEGVQDYAEEKSFQNGLDILRKLHKGNSEMQEVIDSFEEFNLDLHQADLDKKERPNCPELKTFDPTEWKYKPDRKDVQPLAVSGF